MPGIMGIGQHDFEVIRREGYFYIDKTKFIQQWWESGDLVTLITRPRRFGKTLAMSMVEKFFSAAYAGRGELFEGLSIWETEGYRALQGSYPVIALSFSDIKESTFREAYKKICKSIQMLYNRFAFLAGSDLLNDSEKTDFHAISADMERYMATLSLKMLSEYLCRYYGKRVIILLDEYDTPMQEAYINGYWEEMAGFIRSLFNSTFKANPCMERAIMTGITRVSKESVFSDLNNLEVVTTTSRKYEDIFGFTESEVFAALEEAGLPDKKAEIKRWYDGFTFGGTTDVYNPWSIINYLDKRRLSPYWANTSSNQLAGKLIREGSADVKQAFEVLLAGGTLKTEIDEQVVYHQLDQDEGAIWSLLLAGGYLKVRGYREVFTEKSGEWKQEYILELTNLEVKIMFRSMVKGWFGRTAGYNGFIRALLAGDLDAMNDYMNRVASSAFSYFDTGAGQPEPERFYHGFVLGLMAELSDRYLLTSNRESGFGRYDVMLEPLQGGEEAFILEFKVFRPNKEKDLEDAVQKALNQIEVMDYEAVLAAKGIPKEKIKKYGFAFEGRRVLIGSSC